MNIQSFPERMAQALESSVIVDVETTGLEPRDNRIIEVATLTVRNTEPVEMRRWLLNPGAHISEFITDLTGITNAHVASCPSFADVALEIMEVLSPRHTEGASQSRAPMLVGHNVAFDYSFLQHELLRDALAEPNRAEPSPDHSGSHSGAESAWWAPYTPPLLCTAEISRSLIPRQAVGRYRLDAVAGYLSTPHRPRHRAEVDVWATYDVLRGLSKLALANDH